MTPSRRPYVVIVGAGFGGLRAARALRSAPVDVLMIDRSNYHTFQPLLYQVATAGLEPGEIAHSARGVFQNQRNFLFRLGLVTGVDFNRRQVILDADRRIEYDYLVLSPGASTEYFNVEGAREYAHSMKSLADAVNLRSHVLRCFEQVAQDPSHIDGGALNFVIAGGGPTGVETAGALIELFDLVLKKDFHEVDLSRARVVLIEMASHLIDPYHQRLRSYALRTVRDRGVEVMLNEVVKRVTDAGVYLESGRYIPTRTLIWTAGVRAALLADRLDVEQSANGRIIVQDDLSLDTHPEVFVVGDTAAAADGDGRLYPQLAPVAVQQGLHAARQIRRRIENKGTERFAYNDPGMMATIGRKSAVVELPVGIRLTGYSAWLIWTVLHIWKLIGFRNRVSVMFDWIYNYFTYDRSTRLIFEAESKSDSVLFGERDRIN